MCKSFVASTPLSQSRFVENISRGKTSWFTKLLLRRFGNAVATLVASKTSPSMAENMLDACYLCIAVYLEVLGNDVTPK